MRNEICISSKFNYRNTISRANLIDSMLPSNRQGLLPYEFFPREISRIRGGRGEKCMCTCVCVCVCVFPDFNTQGTADVLPG